MEVIDRDAAEARFQDHLDLRPVGTETLHLDRALGRILAESVAAGIDVPGFDRANVDGFAVRSADTAGALEEAPARLRLNPETIEPGSAPGLAVAPGTATPIATGAILPRGADAVVMVEHTEVSADESALAVASAVGPGQFVAFAGTDMGRGETVLHRAHPGERLPAPPGDHPVHGQRDRHPRRALAPGLRLRRQRPHPGRRGVRGRRRGPAPGHRPGRRGPPGWGPRRRSGRGGRGAPVRGHLQGRGRPLLPGRREAGRPGHRRARRGPQAGQAHLP
ncbi:MAG: hypothetical protein GWO00_07555, partial [Gemmatimonadetes bacterium]|nr:hypothetical protein [Gemmatimonadota bacterium]NIU35478.1 hypothetical protein [Gemmatimonadota bacterium]NIV61034.1 hypothetical protein [Gemmatimonadota bacterium]NIV82401.1 hypothetical protein [Gemmatimonadota bacterium]NIW65416.1 hypothetical protein [Gemmatimonadota bacterium]